MKKVLSILLSILLVSTLVFTVTSCKKDKDTSEALDRTAVPVTISIEEETDDDGKTYTLTEISLSALAKDYIDNGKLKNLKELFGEHSSTDAQYFTVDDTQEKVIFEIPSDVTHIAANSIVNLSFITDLVVGDNVKEIEKGALVGLSGLESITLPFIGGKVGAVNDGKLFSYIFGTIGGDGLTSVTQNYNGGTESSATNYVPTSLKTVTVTGKVDYTKEDVRYYVNDDNEHVVLGTEEAAPEGKTAYTVTSKSYKDSAVQPYAFYGVTTIETVIFAGEITEIPEYTFYGCAGIKELSFKDTITIIGKYAYANCTSLRVLTLGAVAIEEGAFSGCTSIGRNTATSIGKLDISLVTSFGKDAFAGCTSVTKENLTLKADFESLTEDEQKALKDAFGEDFFEDEE